MHNELFRQLVHAVRSGVTDSVAKILRDLFPIDLDDERALKLRRAAILLMGRLAERRLLQIAEGHALVDGDGGLIEGQLLDLIAEAANHGIELADAQITEYLASIQQALKNGRPQSGAIFISYRRGDSSDVVARLSERLVQQFGVAAVFRDIDSIPIGKDYRSHLVAAVSRSVVCLVIIGPGWIDALDTQGKRRLDDPNDWVRVEIETALRMNRSLVVPIFVREASVPDATQLPASIAELVYREGQILRGDPDFHRDVDRLIDRLKASLARARERVGQYATATDDPEQR